MIRISDKDRVLAHQRDGVKRYARSYQRPRILLSRKYVETALTLCEIERPRLCEIGCGVLDICGPFALKEAYVTGYEFHQESVDFGVAQYPNATIYWKDVNEMLEVDCDILVACEILEHIDDPIRLMNTVSKDAKILVISINEPNNSRITDGEHCWSFTENDFDNWFVQNGFTIRSKECFENGRLHSMIGVGERL
jgi:2-polyprenyl-3-methyl-5-hydroxy-6-metoxy-1,4-benzoquinol methylase